MNAPALMRLAAVIATLRSGRAITLPFEQGSRGHEWSETFEVGEDRINGGSCLLLSNQSRKGGLVARHRPEPCWWTLEEMLQSCLEWDRETVDSLVEPHPGETVAVDALIRMADLGSGSSATICGTRWTVAVDGGVTTLSCDGDGKWSLDQAICT